MDFRLLRQAMNAVVISLALNAIPMVVPYPYNARILYLYAPGAWIATWLIAPGHDWQLVAIPVLAGLFNVVVYVVPAWIALEAYRRLRYERAS